MRNYIINFTYHNFNLIVLFFMHMRTHVWLVVSIMDREVSVNLLKEANLKPPKHSTSHVWKYFGFRHEGGVINDPTHVIYFHACLSQNLPVDHRSVFVFFFDGLFVSVLCAVAGCSSVLKYCGNTTNLASHLKTQHSSERLFSTAGDIISAEKSRLDPDNLAMLCFLAENLQRTSLFWCNFTIKNLDNKQLIKQSWVLDNLTSTNH